jgi:hypothetical protein
MVHVILAMTWEAVSTNKHVLTKTLQLEAALTCEHFNNINF